MFLINHLISKINEYKIFNNIEYEINETRNKLICDKIIEYHKKIKYSDFDINKIQIINVKFTPLHYYYGSFETLGLSITKKK